MGRFRRLLAGAALGAAVLALAFFLVNAALADPPPTFVVNTTADTVDPGSCTNTCSLRDAISAANAVGGATIDFAAGDGVKTITLDTQLGPLPTITAPVTIDGTSQASIAPSPFGIAIDGSQLTGLVLGFGSGGSTIRGLALGNFTGPLRTDSAIEVNSDGNTIAGNSIGVAADGLTAAPNKNGIVITGDSNTIGGNTAADRDVVVNSSGPTGSGEGIFVFGNHDNFTPSGNAVLGNYVGVLADGSTVAANEDEAVQVIEAADTTIGGPDKADGNVIAPNGDGGIFLGVFNGDTIGSGTTIQHNLIGLSADGSDSLGPASGNGIDVEDRGSNTIADNAIADTYQGIDICDSPGNTVVRNVVGANSVAVHNEGISMENDACAEDGAATGNTIGGSPGNGNTVIDSALHDIAVDADQNTISFNTVTGTGNNVSGSGGPDIDVDASGNKIVRNTITGAVSGDTPPGDGVEVESGSKNTISRNSIHGNAASGIHLLADANDDQSAPDLQGATFTGGNIEVQGSLTSSPDGTYQVELFQSPTCEQGGAGVTYLGTISVDVGEGAGTFDEVFPAASSGDQVTATATAPDGSTSEFSNCANVEGTLPSTIVVNTATDSDDGISCAIVCSLRDAINATNAAGGGFIEFDIPGGWPQTINLSPGLGSLPSITAPVVVDGATQAGTPPGDPGVTIEGDGIFIDGLDLAPGSGGSTIRGLAIDNVKSESGSPQAIKVESDGNTIQGDYFGISADSSSSHGVMQGIVVTGNDNTIGGDSSAGEGNVIAAVFPGVGIDVQSADDTFIQGNLIGLNPDGSTSSGTIGAIRLEGATNTVIGNDADTSQLNAVQAHPELGNVIAGPGSGAPAISLGDDPTITTGTSGTIVAGNFIGVDRSGKQTAGWDTGIDIQDSGPNQIGPGNVIAHSGQDGIVVLNDGDGPQGTGNRIVANSIFDSGIRGISVHLGNPVPAPVVTDITAGTVSGTVSSQNNDPVFVELFVNPSCDAPYASGAGKTYDGFEATAPGTFGVIPFTGLTPGEGVTVTATDQVTGDTSEFSNCFTVGGGGSLSGSVDQSIVKPVDLTAIGTSDWALWGLNSSGNQQPSALTPSETKANGGREISDLSIVNGDGTPTRGFGAFADSLLPYNFSWTDGAPDAAAQGAHGGLTAPAAGQGLSFTVPADTTPRTLTVWTSAHFVDGTFTAHLSDGSAPDYTQAIHAGSGSSPNSGDNAPETFTLDYKAASANAHLTVTLTETSDNCGGCDDVVIYAAALSGSHATGVSANLGSDASVAMSGSVPTSHIPLAAFDPQPPGAPPLNINGLQLANTQLANTQLAHTQLAHTQLANTQLANTQLANTQLAHTQLAHTQLANTQLANTQLAHTQLANTQLAHTQLAHTGLPLNTVPLDPTLFPNGWAALLQGTTLDGQPLQTITLADALALTTDDVPDPPSGKTAQDVIAAIQGLSFADIELPESTLGQITIGALALGPAQVNELGGDLQSDIESQLQSWCQGFVPASDPQHFCTGDADGIAGGGPGIGYLSMLQLGLLGAPVATLQLANTQLAHTQLANTQLANTQLANTQLAHTPVEELATSASGIVGMQLAHTDLTSGLGISGLFVHDFLNDLPSGGQNTVFDCSNPSNFNCDTGTLAQAEAAGAIEPTATVGDIDVGDFLHSVTIYQLLQTVLGAQSDYADFANFGDLVGLFLRNSDVQWESLSPDVLAIFDPSRPSMSMTAGFSAQGTGTPSADVKIDLPAGFDFVPGSASLTENESSVPAPGDPTITNTTSGLVLEWHFDSIDADASYALKFNVYGGTTVGPTAATETITAGGHSSSSLRSFSVDDSNPNSSATDPTAIDMSTGHDSVELSTLPTAGAIDYYKIPMPDAGTRIQVHLTNLAADYDLALYSAQSTSVRTTTNLAPPLQDGVVPDTQVNLNNGSSGQLTPTGLEDVPDPGIPLRQLSDNRHLDDEDVGLVSPGGGGFITIAVFGYNGAFSPQAYTLRVRETAPPATATCDARSLPDSDGTTSDSLPDLSSNSLPANLNTIILVNEKRLGDTYGSAAESTAVTALDRLAGDSGLGVSGVVVPVESLSGVSSLYDAWDANPCNPDSANAIANAIADEVDRIVALRPSVKYVVFGGGDDQIPFFRMPDLSLVANESGFAGQFAPNEYQGSLAAGDLLSDDPYLDTQPVPASGQQLFPPNLAGGRLVETAQEIANAVTAFEHAPTPGELQRSTAFVSGYDFVADGADRVATNLGRNGVTVNTLGSATSNFSAADLLAGAFPLLGGPADVNSWNGHYDNYRAQMANGDILSTSDLPGTLNNGIFFTMGCHAGFQTTDAVVGSTVLDWPQYFAEHNTGFVGNTGFGLGETDSVGFSEELMADFAGKLTASSTLGDALLQAKQQYYLSRVAFSNYDEKALSEAELYGLPMYGVGHAPHALAALSAPDPSSDPVTGATTSTSPSQGSLSSFPGTNVESSNFAVTPHFVGPVTGENGQYYTNDGQVQAPNYRPLQPYVSLPAGRSDSPGLFAHGVVIDALTSSDDPGSPPSGFLPDNVRPTLNSSADEPPPSFNDESWPEKIPTLVSLGQNQNVNLATGQFFTQESAPSTTGVERKWTQIDGRVTYSTSQDYTPPTIDSIHAFESDPGQTDDVLAFSGQFSDLDPTNPATGHPGTVVFAQAIYDDGTGHWHAVQLQQDQDSGLWSAGVPFSGSQVQYFVEVCDAAGNCGYSSNKGNYFDAEPLPPPTVGTSLTLSPDRQPDAHGTWYTGTLHVAVASNAPQLFVTVDGVTVTPVAGQVTLSGDGAHIVDATDSDGNTVTGVYLIDHTGPTITHAISPAAPDGSNGWYTTAPTVSFACSDNVSGVKTCGIGGGPATQTTLSSSASPQSVSATATDNAGNPSGPDSASGIKVDTTSPAGGQISVVAGFNTTGTVAVSETNASDAESGMASNQVQRKLAPLAAGTCGAFDATWSNVTLSSGQNTVASGKCVQYQLVSTDNAGLVTTSGPTGIVKVDTTAPTGGAISVTAGFNTTGTVPVSVTNATDPESGMASNQVQRKLASFSNGACGTFDASWSNVTLVGGNDTVPGGKCVQYQLVSTDNAGPSTTTGPTGIVKVDTTAPAGGAISVVAGFNTTGTVAVSETNASDAESGMASNQVQRKLAPLAAGTCGAFDATWSNVTLSSGQNTVASGKCVQYQLVSTDNAGLVTTSGPTGIVKVDTTAPTGGAISVAAGFNTSGTVPVSVTNATDPESGMASNQVQRKLASFSNGACGTFDASWSNVTLVGGNDTVPGGKCVQYQLVSKDNAGLSTTTGPTGIVKVKQTPTITWNPPATMLFGTRLSSTQLNATASVPGTFLYIPPAGTLLQPGSQLLSVIFTPTDTIDYNSVPTSRSITVGFSQPCLTGSLSGSLTVKSGNAYCIQGGKVSGSVTVQSGGSLYVFGGAISGSLTSTGATALTLCGLSVSGSVSASSSSGLVEIGGASGSGCAANKLSSSLTLSGNNAGVTAVGNTISGSVTASSNKGGVLFSDNKVSGGSITVNGNSGGVTFTNNNVSGNVTITNNTGGFAFSGNTISGTVTLKNNTP